MNRIHRYSIHWASPSLSNPIVLAYLRQEEGFQPETAVPLQRHWVLEWARNWIYFPKKILKKFFHIKNISYILHRMNGNRPSGLRKDFSGPSLHGGNCPYQKGIAAKGDFRQASQTMQKTWWGSLMGNECINIKDTSYAGGPKMTPLLRFIPDLC